MECLGKDCSGQEIIPVSIELVLKTNAHPNTDGTEWGWIEGCDKNICWSNNKKFNREKAREIVSEFNSRTKIQGVICSDLTQPQWARLAGHVDNEFFGKELAITRCNGYYLLGTDKCDSVSQIRVYCRVGIDGIKKIEVCGSYTNGWQEIHPGTYRNIDKFLKESLN